MSGSDMDVSLRLRLDYQKRNAEQAERDLKDLRAAADRIGKSRGGEELSDDLKKIGSSADDAKQKIGAIGNGLTGLSGQANDAAAAIGKIKTEANEARGAVGRIDDGAFAGLKSDAASAKQAITEIGLAADTAQAKIRQIRPGYSIMNTPGGRLVAPQGSWQTQGGMMSTAEGALDQFGVPFAVGAGGAYLAGAVPAGIALASGAAVNAAAGDEQRSDALRVTGEYDETEQRRIDKILEATGRRHGVGTAKAQDTFGTLISNGVNAKDAATMTDRVIKVGKATSSDPVDVAGTTVSMREIMGIKPDKMGGAYESLAIGGKMGKFEVKDMAVHGPSMFAAMAGQGSKDIDGVRLTAAIAQSIAKKSGNNDKAANTFEAMLNDMVSPDVAERFKEGYGKNIYDIRKDAIAAGKDPVLESLRAYHEAVGGDEEKTRDLFRNSEAYKGYAAVFGDLTLIVERMKQMESGSGAIDKDYDTNTDNLNSQKDRLFSNLSGNIKDLAEPLLPILKGIVKAAADQIENARDQQETNPLSNFPGGGTITEALKMWLEHNAPGRKQPSAIDRFLYGDAAGGIDLKEQMGINLGPTAQTSMQGYREGLVEEGAKAEQEAQSIADRIKALLGFTVSPVISPTYTAPGGPQSSPAPGERSSIHPTSNRINQTIISPNPQHAALRANRMQERGIRQAHARSFADTGRRLA